MTQNQQAGKIACSSIQTATLTQEAFADKPHMTSKKAGEMLGI